MSTCQSDPDAAPESLDEPRRLEVTEPAELGRRRALPTFLDTPPALEVDLFFLTRPPSFDKKSEDDGDAGALPEPWAKYSVPPADAGVDETGELGRMGEWEPPPLAFHWRPSIGR
jgi:hypothetical protein